MPALKVQSGKCIAFLNIYECITQIQFRENRNLLVNHVINTPTVWADGTYSFIDACFPVDMLNQMIPDPQKSRL